MTQAKIRSDAKPELLFSDDGIPTIRRMNFLPMWACVAFASRCARRVQPFIQQYWPDIPDVHLQSIEECLSINERGAVTDNSMNALINRIIDASNGTNKLRNRGEALLAGRSCAAIDAVLVTAYAIKSAIGGAKWYAADNASDAAQQACAAVEPNYQIVSDIRKDYDALASEAAAARWTDESLEPLSFFTAKMPVAFVDYNSLGSVVVRDRVLKRIPVTSDWECFLLPVSLLKDLRRLPMHEICAGQLKHLIVPATERMEETIGRELARYQVCAVSWRWSDSLPTPATFDRLKDWSPMSDLQFRRLKELAADTQASYLWVDWSCVPQLSSDTMKFINASYDIYSQAQRVVFLPRIKELRRRGWPRLSTEAAREAIGFVRASAEGVVSSGMFSPGMERILQHSGRAGRLEMQLQAAREKTNEVSAQLESVLNMILRLLAGEDVVYPTFDYYARAWTLAERLAAFKPSKEAPIRLGDMQNAGDALLYGMASFWRDVHRHAGAYVRTERPSLEVSDLSEAVYLRGVDPSEEGVTEMFDDMNRMVQLAPLTLGIASETAALAVICIEWLLHEETGVADDLGKLAAVFLGECSAYTSMAVAGASMQEKADPVWFRKYMYFQAGSVYGSTVTRDLILAVYRSCGLQQRENADEALESCLREVFGDSATSRQADTRPDIDRLCREALRHEDLHTHMLSMNENSESMSASDFAPMMPPSPRASPVIAAAWHEWLIQSGVLVSWWFSTIEQAMPGGATEYIDVEQLYCEDITSLAGLTFDELLQSTVTVVYKLERLDDRKWRIPHLSFSRRAGRCGEGLSPYRGRRGVTLENLLSPDILREGRAQPDLMAAWNQRFLKSLDEAVHGDWLQCISSTDILITS